MHDRFRRLLGGTIDVAMFGWASVQLLLGFDARLLYGFIAPIKGEGVGGEQDVPSELLPTFACFPVCDTCSRLIRRASRVLFLEGSFFGQG